MKHPADRRIFFTYQSDNFLSLNTIRQLTQSGKLSAFDVVFDVDGNSYAAKSIAEGRMPRWAMTAEHDPMLHDIPMPSEEDVAMANEFLLDEDAIAMPREPKAKTVSHYLKSEPRIASLVLGAEHRLFG